MRSVSRTYWAFALMIIVIGGYWAVLTTFGTESLYWKGFDSSGSTLVLYNLLRVAFGAFLLGLFVATGDLLTRAFDRVEGRERSAVDWVLLRLILGFALWNLATMFLGLAGLLHRPLLIALSSLALGGCLFFRFYKFPGFSRTFQQETVSTSERAARVMAAFGFGLFLTSSVVLLVTKGVFPAGGHDYYTHYFHFYSEVANSGVIRPNNVWYHYYYSKGAGIFFLAMVLTDPLAPALVTFCVMASAAIAIERTLGYLSVPAVVRWVVSALFLLLYVFTPGPPHNMNHGGWGDFEKLHELQTALLMFIVYALIRKNCDSQRSQRSLVFAVMLALCAAVVTTPVIAFFYLAAAAFMGGVLVLHGKFRELRDVALTAASIVLTFGSILVLNQVQAGLASDQGITFFWRFADFDKLAEWGVLPELLWVYAWHIGNSMAGSPPLDGGVIQFIFQVFRLDLIWPLPAILALFTVPNLSKALRRPRIWTLRTANLYLIAALAAAGLALAITFGRAQDISFYRFSSFLVPLSLIFGFVLFHAMDGDWHLPAPRLHAFGVRSFARASLLSIWFVFVFAPVSKLLNSHRGHEVIKVAWAFARGKFSIGEAYSKQTAWPGRPPWGGTFPAAREAFERIPLGARLRSLNNLAYCMAPFCRIESHLSYKLGADYLAAMYGSADVAREALVSSGLTYFFVSSQLPVQDPLAGNALFHPGVIRDQMGIVWTDGVSALLTWRGAPGVSPISDSWIASYASRFQESKIDLYSSASTDLHIARILKQIQQSGRPSDLKDLNWQSGKTNGLQHEGD